ncbi:hypothetical protein PZA22_07535 [Pectobacterium polaris]|uniref:hypothetical protein n=1 Tax=Pectobacterium polaris TaxID=2042057 RepID=UPI0023AFF71E|nr:hypothetical protein [Pectobacterium polaris]MDE8754348.1 hypothetical protein [Pectobacterium polaris]
MKIDKNLERANYTSTQIFFLETWYNLCVPEALDSERINYLNPLNGLNELLELYSLGDKYNAPAKRLHIISELLLVLNEDITLKNDEFNNLPKKIINLFSSIVYDNTLNEGEKINKIDSTKNIIISFSKELIYELRKSYRCICANEIIYILLNKKTLSDEEHEEIYKLTNSLMSLLMTEGMPLTELNSIYKNTLTGTNRIEGTSFSDRLEWFKKTVTKEKCSFNIEIKLKSKKLYELINIQSSKKVSVNFSELSVDPTANNDEITVRTKVNTLSKYSAKKQAEHKIQEIIDCYSYILEKDHVSIYQAFSILDDEGNIVKKLTFRDVTSNDEDKFNYNIFNTYTEVIDRLLKDDNTKELRLKLLSSFRQYYNGISSLSMESKFVSFWSALESLTLGASEKKLSHDAHVLHVVIPNIGVNYITKRLSMFRKALRYINIVSVNDGERYVIISELNNKDLFNLFKNPIITANLASQMDGFYYLEYKFKKFTKSISTCELLYNSLMKHEQKVRYHINRLYRVRNGIVHNALSYPVLDLLCLNLEHYLRSCINSVFDMIEKNPTISTTSEAFFRFNYEKDNAMVRLNPTHGIIDKKKIAELQKKISDNSLIPTDIYFIDLLL